MFYDLQDISIPFPEYQITEEETNDIKQRVKKLVNEYDVVDFSLEELASEELYQFYIIYKNIYMNTNGYILIYFGLTNTNPTLIYLTPDKDWIGDAPLAFLLHQAKTRIHSLCFQQTFHESIKLIVMAEIREQLHICDILPRNRSSKEYKSAYIDAMQLLLMMLYDIDFKEIMKSNPRIDEELEQFFSIEDIDSEEYLKKQQDKVFDENYIERFC